MGSELFTNMRENMITEYGIEAHDTVCSFSKKMVLKSNQFEEVNI